MSGPASRIMDWATAGADVEGCPETLELMRSLQCYHHPGKEAGDHGQDERVDTHGMNLGHQEAKSVRGDKRFPQGLQCQ